MGVCVWRWLLSGERLVEAAVLGGTDLGCPDPFGEKRLGGLIVDAEGHSRF